MSRPAQPHSAAEPHGDAWRIALNELLPTSGGEAASPRTHAHTALALYFELRELIPRSTSKWNGPTSRTAGAPRRAGQDGIGNGEYRLAVRPVARTARGWARGSITWSNIPHLLNRQNLDPAQHRWFCQFVALHRAGTPATPGQDLDWVFLGDWGNPVLWQLLRQAAELGIPCVGPTAAARVLVGERATLNLTATRDADGIRMRPTLTIDGSALPVSAAHAIGTHGIYTFTLTKPHTYCVAPTEMPLTSEQLTLLSSSRAATGITVPATEADEFLRDFLPRLREGIEVTSPDVSIPLPPLAPPTLVVTATFGPRHSLTLAWRWEHRRRASEPPRVRDLLPEGVIPESWFAGADETSALPRSIRLRGIDAAECAVRILPALQEIHGVRVESAGTDPHYQELTGTPRLTVTTIPTERPDWFDLGVIVTVDGQDVPFAPLFRALATGTRKLLLVDGRYLSLTHPALVPLAELISASGELAEWETTPVMSRYQTSLWADIEDLADESRPAREWRDLVAGLSGDTPQSVTPPRGLNATLRPYQAEGFSWLAVLWQQRLGAILADDMGLGKTIQCLALMQHVAETRPPTGARQPFLVVAPTSVVSTWVSEARRFTPDLVICEITTTEAVGTVSLSEAAAMADIVVTSYALLRLDIDAYRAVATGSGWAGLILDEAQFVKNHASRVHECARDLPVRFKLAVTGTPLENSLTELHALTAIVAPGLFPSRRHFVEEYVRPIETEAAGVTAGPGAGSAVETASTLRTERLDRLRRRIRPFMLRRTKEVVAPELPAKQEQTLHIELTPEHRDLYDVFLQRERRKLLGLIEDLDRNRFIVFRSLTLLRMLALDASLLDDAYAGIPSAKLDTLLEQLGDVVHEGHRALVFSQFTTYLGKAAERLDAAGIRYTYLDGSTLNRRTVIEEFKTGDAHVFLISLKAGGVGLTLTEADYVFLLDPWWNPATEAQAIDRTHRIGQDKSVMVYRMIAAGTIEEKVMKLKERKAALFDAVVNDEALFGSALTAEDIRALLT
ncbi:DEAD/DEAH box helicase [Klugiella xanthotipulae]|uniref:Helicase-like protein n=1 Tax=Klugiella xanthotipulae TaxID=244735 RepID=A0A543HYA7_9MICO|nr:DEAD/DEAH box helicase [Klugiella xanthotipulae]TQM63260.1 helicase-like protein [Klugiella xanthotipulae]